MTAYDRSKRPPAEAARAWAGRGLAPRNSGRGRGSDFASSQGASIQTSRSSSVVRITGIAFGWIGSTTALGAVVRRAEASVSSAFTMATLKISTGSLTSRLGKTTAGAKRHGDDPGDPVFSHGECL